MLSFLIDALAGILAVVILVLNGISYCFERYFYKKVSIQPEKLAVVVTGCDSGFGEMISIKLASMGFHVISGCLTQEGVDRMSSIVKLSLICDVTNETDVAKLADSTEAYCKKKKCKVWAIVNNAGIADGGALDWTGIHVWRRVMEVNFFGVVIVTRAFLPLLKRCPESRVINLSSMAGLLAGANIGPYFASKHAVEGMAKALREELRPWGIHVSNLNPAFMKTPILLNGLEAAKRSFESAPENITSQYDQSFIQYHADMMTNTAEDPVKVVNSLVDAITDKHPPMWYFPGNAASVMRVLSTASSGVNDFLHTFVTSKGTPMPTPEALQQFRFASD